MHTILIYHCRSQKIGTSPFSTLLELLSACNCCSILCGSTMKMLNKILYKLLVKTTCTTIISTLQIYTALWTHRGCEVGIATGYRLDGVGIESRQEARFCKPVQTGPGDNPDSCTMGTGSFPGVKSGQGVMLTPHPLLVLWPRKSRAITLLPLWAVRPVQSLSACTRVQFTFLPMDTLEV